MSEITPEMVRLLRERTGAGLMECKKALTASGADEEAAVDWLRKQGLKTAEKRASREMGQGRILAFVAPKAHVGSLVALTCETDFVAATDDFNGLLTEICQRVAEHSPADGGALLRLKDSRTAGSLEDSIKLFIGKLGENTQVARFRRLEDMQGRVGSYVHHDRKKGALAAVTTGADEATAAQVLKELCMHIVSKVPAPVALTRAQIPAAEVERERAIYLEEVKGKPEQMQTRIVAGKFEKYYADLVLPEQKWFTDDSKSVQQVLEQRLGPGTHLTGFERFQIGK